MLSLINYSQLLFLLILPFDIYFRGRLDLLRLLIGNMRYSIQIQSYFETSDFGLSTECHFQLDILFLNLPEAFVSPSKESNGLHFGHFKISNVLTFSSLSRS